MTHSRSGCTSQTHADLEHISASCPCVGLGDSLVGSEVKRLVLLVFFDRVTGELRRAFTRRPSPCLQVDCIIPTWRTGRRQRQITFNLCHSVLFWIWYYVHIPHNQRIIKINKIIYNTKKENCRCVLGSQHHTDTKVWQRQHKVENYKSSPSCTHYENWH